jgi:hypothetical protein
MYAASRTSSSIVGRQDVLDRLRATRPARTVRRRRPQPVRTRARRAWAFFDAFLRLRTH